MAEQHDGAAKSSGPRTAVAAPKLTLARAGVDPRDAWWRTALLLLTTLVLGIVPMLLTGEVFGAWRVHVPGTPSFVAATPTPTVAVDLALPRAAWVATTSRVFTQPGAGALRATLEPGFPVTLTAHLRAGGILWSHIQWAGPTHTTGGAGWVPDAALLSYGGTTRPIGDLGALAPSLGQSLAAYGSNLAASIYFPDSGQLYYLRADQAFPLGNGFRAILLATRAAYTEAEPASSATTPTPVASAIEAGDTSDGAALYAQVGGASAVTSYLSGAGITGLRPALGSWLLTEATPQAMGEFYTALATGGTLTDADRAALLGMLAQANAATCTRLTGSAPLEASSIVVASAMRQDTGWTSNASGMLVPTHGPRAVVAAVILGQPTQAAADAALVAFYSAVAALLTQG